MLSVGGRGAEGRGSAAIASVTDAGSARRRNVPPSATRLATLFQLSFIYTPFPRPFADLPSRSEADRVVEKANFNCFSTFYYFFFYKFPRPGPNPWPFSKEFGSKRIALPNGETFAEFETFKRMKDRIPSLPGGQANLPGKAANER